MHSANYKCLQHREHLQCTPLAVSERLLKGIDLCPQLFPDIVCHLEEGTGHLCASLPLLRLVVYIDFDLRKS